LTQTFFPNRTMATRTRESPEQSSRQAGDQTVSTWTIRRLLQWTTDYFHRKGLSSARLDAEVLLAHVLEKDRLGLYLDHDAVIAEPFLRQYRQLILRRAAAEPVAYLTGQREFFSTSFRVSPAVMIPRPETEHLIEHGLSHLRHEFPAPAVPSLRVLDIGSGCGNLPAILSRNLEGAWVVSVDVSAAALAVARTNQLLHADSGARVCFVRGDLLTWLHPRKALFHLIVSNPPYVSEQEWEGLDPEVRRHEPKVAICAGPKGTEFQETILGTAGRFLCGNGALIMEIGEGQSATLLQLAERSGLYAEVRVFPDYAGKPRVLVGKRKQDTRPGTTP